MSQHLDGLNLVELLDLLEPVPQPMPISMAPQTPGWIVLAVLTLTLMLCATRYRLHRYRANAYRRAALAELELLIKTGESPAEISVLLRRTALVAYPRDQVASLHGDRWLRFLDAHFPGDGFSTGPGRILATAPWRPVAPDPALTALARDWICKHQRHSGEPC